MYIRTLGLRPRIVTHVVVAFIFRYYSVSVMTTSILTDDNLYDQVSVPVQCSGRSIKRDLDYERQYNGDVTGTKVKAEHWEYTFTGKRAFTYLDMEIEVEVKIRHTDEKENYEKNKDYQHRPFIHSLPKEGLEVIKNGLGIVKICLP